jgi:hypothetical protein
MIFPVGLPAIHSYYGDPSSFVLPDGGIDRSWESEILGFVSLPHPLPLGWNPSITVSRLRCHRRLVESLGNIFETIDSIDAWPLLQTFDGVYSWRTQSGSGTKLSLHAWGAAIDLNARTNQRGASGDMPWEIREIFAQAGWSWGGIWKSPPDPMHFQAAGEY